MAGNPKFILAGAAIGAYTQDPIEHPLAGIVGLGIGGYIGYSITPEVIGETIRGESPSSVLKADLDSVGRTSPVYDQIHKSIHRTMRRTSRFDNSNVIRQDYMNTVLGIYKEIGGEAEIDLSKNPKLGQMLLNTGSNSDEARESVRNIAKEIFSSEEDAKKFLTASRIVRVRSVPGKDEVNGGFSRNGMIETDFRKLSNETLHAAETPKQPGASVSIGKTRSRDDAADIIKKHLIDNLNYPEDIAERHAKNIATLTKGADISLQDNKLKVTANAETVTLPLEQYDQPGGVNKAFTVTDGGNMYTAARHNPFLSEHNGRALGFNMHYIDPTGEIKQTSSIVDGIKHQSFSAAEVSLAEWVATGKQGSLKEIAEKYTSKKTFLGKYDIIKAKIESDPLSKNSVENALHTSSVTDAKYQLSYNQDGVARIRQIDHVELQDISNRLALSLPEGYKQSYRGIGVNDVSGMTLQVKVPEEEIRSAVVEHTARGTDNRLIRKNAFAKSNYGMAPMIEVLKSRGADVSSLGASSVLRVETTSRSMDSIANYIGSGYTVADGQVIGRRSALRGAEVGATFDINLGKVDEGASFDLTGGKITEDARLLKEAESGSLHTYRGGNVIAITADGTQVSIPEYISHAELSKTSVNKNGDTVLSFVGKYNPVDAEDRSIKLFGDVKATSILLDDETYEKVALFTRLEDKGLMTPETGLTESGKKLFDYFGIKIKDNNYKELGEIADELDSNTVKRMAKKLDIDLSSDIIVRSGDSKLAGIINDSLLKSEDEVRGTLNKLSDSISEGSPLKKMVLEAMDGTLNKNQMAGIGFAITALTNDKSSQTAFMSLLTEGISELGEQTNSKASIMAYRAQMYSKLIKAAEDGDESAQRELFATLRRLGEGQMESGRANIFVPASIDLPIPMSRNPSASWLQLGEIRAQFGGDQFAEQMIRGISSRNESAIYEARALLSAQENRGREITEIFGEDLTQTKKRLSRLFDTTSTKDRADALRELTGEVPDDGILNVKISRPGKNIRNIPVTLYTTNRSGVFDQDGIDLMPLKDKATRDVLEKEIIYREAVNTGSKERMEIAARELDRSVEELEGLYKQADKPLSKEALKVFGHNAADLQMFATGGDHAKLWQEFADKGIHVSFINRQGLAELGLDISIKSSGKSKRYTKKIDGYDSARLVTIDKEGNIPSFINAGREPVAGSNSNFQAVLVYDPRLDYIDKPGLFFTENKIAEGVSEATRPMISAADFDGDTMRVMSLDPITRNPEAMQRIEQSMEEGLNALKGEEGRMSASLLAKANKMAEEVVPGWSTDNPQEFIKGRFKAQERKNMAPIVTELAQIASDSIKNQVKIERQRIADKYGVTSADDINSLPDNVRAKYAEDLARLRAKRRTAMSINQHFVEKTLKAIHGKGGSGNIAQDIIAKLKEATSFNNQAEAAADLISDVIRTSFKGVAREIDISVDAKGLSSTKTTVEMIEEATGFIHQSVRNYGSQIANDANRMVGGEGFGKSLQAAANVMRDFAIENPGALPTDAKPSTIRTASDVTSSLIQTVKNNRVKILGGLGALGATSFVLGSETPDTSPSPMANSPVARTGAVLPPISQTTAHITESVNRGSMPGGSVNIQGRLQNNGLQYADDSLKRRVNNMFMGDSAGRTTVRYQGYESY